MARLGIGKGRRSPCCSCCRRASLSPSVWCSRGTPAKWTLHASSPIGCLRAAIIFLQRAGLVMPEQRKREVYALCCEFDLLLLEDDPYYILQFRNGGHCFGSNVCEHATRSRDAVLQAGSSGGQMVTEVDLLLLLAAPVTSCSSAVVGIGAGVARRRRCRFHSQRSMTEQCLVISQPDSRDDYLTRRRGAGVTEPGSQLPQHGHAGASAALRVRRQVPGARLPRRLGGAAAAACAEARKGALCLQPRGHALSPGDSTKRV